MMHYRKIDLSDREEFTRAWGEFKEQVLTTDGADEGENETTGEQRRGQKRKIVPSGSVKASAKQKTRKTGANTESTSPKGTQNTAPPNFKQQVAEGTKFMGVYLKQVKSAEILLAEIDDKDDYDFARGPQKDELKATLGLCQQGLRTS